MVGQRHSRYSPTGVRSSRTHATSGSVLSCVRVEGHGTGSGIVLERDIWHVAEIREGRLKWSAFFRTEAEALEAVELQE